MEASQPEAGSTTALAARYEVRTQDTSSTPADSEPWMCGSATFVTVTSSTCMTVTIMTVKVMSHLRVAPTGAPASGGAGASRPGASSLGIAARIEDARRPGNPLRLVTTRPRVKDGREGGRT